MRLLFSRAWTAPLAPLGVAVPKPSQLSSIRQTRLESAAHASQALPNAVRSSQVAVRSVLWRRHLVSEAVGRACDDSASERRCRVPAHVATPRRARETRVQQEHVHDRATGAADLLEAQLDGKQRVARAVERHERPKLRRQRLAELTVGTPSRQRPKSLGGQRPRIGRVRRIALRGANELLRKYPPRAEPALAEREGDLVIQIRQQLPRTLSRFRPAEAV